MQVGINTDKQNSISENIHEKGNTQSQSDSSPDLGLSSVLGIFSPNMGNTNEEQSIIPRKKKKKQNRGMGR